MSIPEQHGQKTDSQGNSLFLQDSQLATNAYGLDSYYFLTPHVKYLFFVQFKRIGSSSTSGVSSLIPGRAADATSGLDASGDLGLVVKSIDRPKIAFETEVCNQYNRKRIIQKRMEYKPISIKFNDTVDDKVIKMFQSYFKYYYGDANAPSYPDDVISGSLQYNQWGYIGSILSASLSDYFSAIQIYQLYGGYYDQYDLINPKMVSFDPDDNDYGATGGGHEINMSFNYEAINFVTTAAPLSSNPGLIATMGLDRSDFYEPEDGPTPASEFGAGPSGGFIDDSSILNQGPVGNFVGNVINQTLQSFDGGNKLNISGVFKGALNQTIQTSALQNGVLGEIGSNIAYNSANSGLINQTPLTSLVPGLRSLGL